MLLENLKTKNHGKFENADLNFGSDVLYKLTLKHQLINIFLKQLVLAQSQ